jgi:hypothetical protein
MTYSNSSSRPHQQRPLNPQLLRRIRRIRKISDARRAAKAPPQ